LRTSIDQRIRQLNSADERDWYLAAKAIRNDFKPDQAFKAFETLINVRGRGDRSQRLYMLTCSAGVGARGELNNALLDFGNEAIRTAIALSESPDPTTRAGAISFLGAFELCGNQTALRWSVIKKHLHDPSARVRCSAVGASSLFRNQREEVAAALQELLDDQERPWPGAQPVGVSVKWALEAVRRTGPAQ
jgi:hypothetical protein